MNDNQNTNLNNSTTTGGVAQTAATTTAQPAQPQVAISIGSEQVSAPTAQPMPAPNPAPVQAQPMPAQPAPVAPATPVAATPVQPAAPAESPFFTPESVQPDTQVSPELPPITPAAPVASVVTAQPAPVQAQPQVAQEQPAPEQPVASTNANEPEVIQTAPKSKASNIILIIFVILLIVFVFNIDTVITMYDQYKNGMNPSSPINNNTNNLTDGLILIDDNTSSIRVNDIKFYNFRKSIGKGITFSYEVLAKADDAKELGIYIELYNSEKEIIYKTLFNPSQKLEKDTVRTYTIEVEDDIYDKAFYALAKVYTEEDQAKTLSLTCKLEDNNYSYKNTFNFVNNGLSTYSVEKTFKTEDAQKKLETEFEELKEKNNAVLEDGTLKYTVNLDNDNGDLVLLFEKDTTLKIIKDNLTSKEWNCE